MFYLSDTGCNDELSVAVLEDDVLDLLSKADVQQSLTVSARTTNVQRSETAPLGVSQSQQN